MLPERHTGCAVACQCGARVREGPGSAPVRSGVRRACLHPLCSRTGPCVRRARRKAGTGEAPHSAERSVGTAPSGKPGGRSHPGARALARDRACTGRKAMPHAATRRLETTGKKKAPLDERGFDQHWPKADAGLIRLRRRELQLRLRAGLLLPPRDGRKRPSPARWPRCWRAGARARDDHPGYGWGRP